jgi:hypothetical protein
VERQRNDEAISLAGANDFVSRRIASVAFCFVPRSFGSPLAMTITDFLDSLLEEYKKCKRIGALKLKNLVLMNIATG